MNKDLDILVQKYLNDDLSESEKLEVDKLLGSDEWKLMVHQYSELQKDLDKTLFLESQKEKIEAYSKSNPSRKWIMYTGVGIAAAVIIGVIVFLPQKRADQVTSSQSGETTEDGFSEYELDVNAAEEINNEYNLVGFLKSDQDILYNRSIFAFGEGNDAFSRLKSIVSSKSTGILDALVLKGSPDSVYVFSKTIDGFTYEKHLRFVGETNDFNVYNLISYDIEHDLVQKSILLTRKNQEYYGRYLVQSSDDLPDQILPVGLLYEVEKPDGSWGHQIIVIDDDECLDFPSGNRSCLSFN